MKAKRCPVCGGKPQYVHYAIPGSANDPDGILCSLSGWSVHNVVHLSLN